MSNHHEYVDAVDTAHELLIHYFEQAGVAVTPDVRTEMRDLVLAIVRAARAANDQAQRVYCPCCPDS